jgi:ABC-type molybdate transport system substrate-binding protein
LPAANEIDAYEVKEGTAAMRAYQDMLYGFAKNDPLKKNAIKQALLSYCKLDTLAMVIIYKHWMSL